MSTPCQDALDVLGGTTWMIEYVSFQQGRQPACGRPAGVIGPGCRCRKNAFSEPHSRLDQELLAFGTDVRREPVPTAAQVGLVPTMGVFACCREVRDEPVREAGVHRW